MTRGRFSLAIAALAVVAIVAVAAPKLGDIDWPDFGGEDSEPAAESDSGQDDPAPQQEEAAEEPEQPEEPEELELPDNPDEVKGTESYALTRTPNFRRALEILERRRRSEEGVFDSLRVAPGRIDTVVETATRRINLQIRPAEGGAQPERRSGEHRTSPLKIAFENESDFPNREDYRRYGLTGENIDPRAPARILARIDESRDGSAARDVDYVVISRDIIDFKVNVSAYLKTGPRPRSFLSEPGEPFRAIG